MTTLVDNIELRELRARSRKENNFIPEKSSNLKERHFLEHYVAQDDSLPKLSLTYGCTVSELKQANSIYNEQEFHARKIIKIPIHEYSVLCENSGESADTAAVNVEKSSQLHRSHSEGSLRQAREQLMYCTDTTDLTYPNDDDDYSADDLYGKIEKTPLLSGHSGVRTLSRASNNICDDYLDLVDKDIQHISKRVQSKADIIDIGAHSLTYIQPDKVVSHNNDMLGQAGCISYKGIIFTLCATTVILPLLYLLYFLLLKKKT